ncbi:MAG: hypothetical protein IPG50_08650 [Myxococcales bacterium]|nr:hypothetical protein [Myxococcales bacterium]
MTLAFLAAGSAACSALIGFEAFVGPNDGVVDAGLVQDASASGDTGAPVDAASGEGAVETEAPDRPPSTPSPSPMPRSFPPTRR